MLVTTTYCLQGYRIERYLGPVVAPFVLGGVMAKKFRTGIREVSGGHAQDYTKELDQASDHALSLAAERATEMGANALVGVSVNFQTTGQTPLFILVSVTGTAVIAHPCQEVVDLARADIGTRSASQGVLSIRSG